MREILFRGVWTETGDWVKGFYVRLFDERGNKSHRIYPGYAETDDGDYYPDWYEVAPETVGQFTGLTDKNGTKIFEGDIIKTDNGIASAVSTVKYGHHEPGMFYDLLEMYLLHRPKQLVFGLFAESTRGEQLFMVDSPKCIEVIGNIHDNPELLKGENP